MVIEQSTLIPSFKNDQQSNFIPSFNTLDLIITQFPIPSKTIMDTFDHLIEDTFCQGSWCFRKRRYNHGIIDRQGRIAWSPDTQFYQSKGINQYAGDIIRQFSPLSDTVKIYISELLNQPTYTIMRDDKNYQVGVHQIRILCDDQNPGYPVPEGFHQDGFEFVAIHCMQKHNMVGGISLLREGSKQGDCVLENNVNPGEMLVFDDQRYFHYATPIYAKSACLGYRDMLVITFNQLKK